MNFEQIPQMPNVPMPKGVDKMEEEIKKLEQELAEAKLKAEQYHELQTKLADIFKRAQEESMAAITSTLKNESAYDEDTMTHTLTKEMEKEGLESLGEGMLDMLSTNADAAEKDAKLAEIRISVRNRLGSDASPNDIDVLVDTEMDAWQDDRARQYTEARNRQKKEQA